MLNPPSKKNGVTRVILYLGLAFVALGLAASATGQADNYLPPPDPGYGLYYHGDQGLLEKATRWGYHDGWIQGREDRQFGRESDPKARDNFQKPPDHGRTPGITESQYQRVYQGAFLHGYEHGYRL
jgi:hypothetical protein